MVLTTDLVSYYKLDENAANTTVADSHSTNTGTASTNTSNLYDASGVINSQFDYNGSSDKVTIPSTATFSGNLQGAISMWITPDAVDDFQVFTRSDSASNNFIMFATDNNGYFKVDFNSGSRGIIRATTTRLVATNTYHIVVTSTGSVYKIYINNVDQSLTVDIGSNDGRWFGDFTGEAFNFGVLDRSSPNLWGNGKIDEVAIFDANLSTQSVDDLYNSGDGLAYPFVGYQAKELSDTQATADTVTKTITKVLTETMDTDDDYSLPTIAQSLSVALNQGTITTATLTATLTGSTPSFWMTADGTNFESITDGVAHTFTNPGVDLRWKVQGSGTTITNVKIEYG